MHVAIRLAGGAQRRHTRVTMFLSIGSVFKTIGLGGNRVIPCSCDVGALSCVLNTVFGFLSLSSCGLAWSGWGGSHESPGPVQKKDLSTQPTGMLTPPWDAVWASPQTAHRRTAGAPIHARPHPTATATRVRRGAAPPPRRGKSTQLRGRPHPIYAPVCVYTPVCVCAPV